MSAKRGSRVVPIRARPAERVLLAPFSSRLPPELLQRLQVAAPQLEQRIDKIVATALDTYLRKRSF